MIQYNDYMKLIGTAEGEDVGMSPMGTWGNSAAGLMIVHYPAKSAKRRMLVMKRSPYTVDPGFWGIAGGAIKETEGVQGDPLVTAVTEAYEEMGHLPMGYILEDPVVYNKAGTDFNYHTYILVANNDDFTPKHAGNAPFPGNIIYSVLNSRLVSGPVMYFQESARDLKKFMKLLPHNWEHVDHAWIDFYDPDYELHPGLNAIMDSVIIKLNNPLK